MNIHIYLIIYLLKTLFPILHNLEGRETSLLFATLKRLGKLNKTAPNLLPRLDSMPMPNAIKNIQLLLLSCRAGTSKTTNALS